MPKAKAKRFDMQTWPMLYKSCDGKTMEWEIWTEEQSDGTGIVFVRFGYEGGKKRIEKKRITEGKKLGTKAETTPYQQSVLEAEAKWKMNLSRKGYGETVEASAVTRSASPMLAQTYKPKTAVDWGTAYAQPKLDGYRCLATFTPKGVMLRSRENLPINLPHIAQHLALVMERGETFDGELYAHDLKFEEISGICKRKKERHEKTDMIRFNAYDLLADWDYEARYRRIEQAVAQSTNYVDLVRTVKVRSREDLAVVEQECLAAGYEGAILRHTRKGYVAGKRAACLLKVKQFDDDEFKVVDVKEGRGTHAGAAIFTCVTPAGHEFDVTAPGKMPEKRAYWENHQQYLGKMLTVQYFEYTKTAEPLPRFPTAKAFKD